MPSAAQVDRDRPKLQELGALVRARNRAELLLLKTQRALDAFIAQHEHDTVKKPRPFPAHLIRSLEILKRPWAGRN